MKIISIDDEVYDLVLTMAETMKEMPAYIIYRSVWREYIAGDEYHRTKEEKDNGETYVGI